MQKRRGWGGNGATKITARNIWSMPLNRAHCATIATMLFLFCTIGMSTVSPPTIYAPIHNVKSSFCFRAGWEGGTRRIFNSVFSQYETGIPVRIKEPKRIAGPSPQQGTALRNVGFKRVITDSMRNRGRKNGEKRARISQAIRKMNAPEPDGIPLV